MSMYATIIIGRFITIIYAESLDESRDNFMKVYTTPYEYCMFWFLYTENVLYE